MISKKLSEMTLEEYEHNRDAYTEAKMDFVRKYTDEARILYGNRY